MMPLSNQDAQVIKLVNAPRLPASLFENAQPVQVRVLSAQSGSASILFAGRQFNIQSSALLTTGQTITAQPSMVNGQLHLKILPDQQTAAQTNTQQNHATEASSTRNAVPLPSWTQKLPESTQNALIAVRQALANQLPLQQLLNLLNDQLSQATAGNKSINNAWQSLINQALNMQAPVTGDKIQQAMQQFNDKFAGKTNSQADWKQSLQTIIQSPRSTPEERHIAQALMSRSDMTQQLQNLQHNAGNAVWLQEIPLKHQDQLSNFTLEIDLPNPKLNNEDQYWHVFVQLELDSGHFTSRVQINQELKLRVQLWAEQDELLTSIYDQSPLLRQALLEQGLEIESMVIVQGKPEPRTEKPMWRHNLVDCHG